MGWSNASLFDWLWLGLGAVALLFAALNGGEAWREYRAACGPRGTPWLRYVAAAELRQAMSVTALAGLITFVGVVALYLPPTHPPGDTLSPLAWAAGIAMFGQAIIVMVMSAGEFISRRRKGP